MTTNEVLASRVHRMLQIAFVCGVMPARPVKCKVSPKKVFKKLCALEILKSDSSFSPSWSHATRVRLQTTVWTSMYFFLTQIVLFAGLSFGSLSYPKQFTLSNEENGTWEATMYCNLVLYAVSMMSTSATMMKRRKLQRFLDTWLLCANMGLDFVAEKNSNAKLACTIDVMHGKLSSWTTSKMFIRNTALLAFGPSVFSLFMIALLYRQQLIVLLVIQVAVQYRGDIGSYLYMMVAASQCDRAMCFNDALREALPTVSRQTAKDLKHFCLTTRKEEPKSQELLIVCVGICHAQRYFGVVFSMTNLLYYVRSESLDFISMSTCVPVLVYYMSILSVFFFLGNHCAKQMNLTKDVLKSTECLNEDSEKEISKFQDAVSENMYYTAGNVVPFTAEGFWQEGQFIFTVVAVMLQLYESDRLVTVTWMV